MSPRTIVRRLQAWLQGENPDQIMLEFASMIPAGSELQEIVDAYWKLTSSAERRALAKFVLETFGRKATSKEVTR